MIGSVATKEAGVLVVTGGSRGIGAATALLAPKRGYAVVVNYMGSKDSADRVVAEIASAGGRAVAVRGNVVEPLRSRQSSRRPTSWAV